VDIPTKEQFQELIDFCKRDYLPSELNIRQYTAVEDLRKILYDFALTREKSLKEMKSLAAFYWLDEGNRDNQYNFNKALAVIPFVTINCIDAWAEENTLIILGRMMDSSERTVETQKCLEDNSMKAITVPEDVFIKILHSQINESKEYELRIIHFVSCLMKYIYPENRHKKTIKSQLTKVISTLEGLQVLEKDLHSYEEFSYLPEIIDICKPLEGRVELYKKILDGGYLPFEKRSQHSHDKRIFILNTYNIIPAGVFSSDSLTSIENIKEFDGYFLEVIEFLMSLSCFDKPMSENSIRNILKSERLRLVNRLKIND